jgi:hypothetical protein
MLAGEITILVVFLLNACLLIGIGIPLATGSVRPNPLYGFRTKQTLQDPEVWYPANRVAGFWLIGTGLAVAGVAGCTFFARVGLPGAPLINLVPLGVGIVGMILHGSLVIRRASKDQAKGKRIEPHDALRE